MLLLMLFCCCFVVVVIVVCQHSQFSRRFSSQFFAVFSFSKYYVNVFVECGFSISVGVFGFRNRGVFVCGVLCSEKDGSSDGLDEPLEADIAES